VAAPRPAAVPAMVLVAAIVAERLQVTAIARLALLAAMFSAGSVRPPLDWALAKFEDAQQQQSKFPYSQKV
jgi:hypothetical protein